MRKRMKFFGQRALVALLSSSLIACSSDYATNQTGGTHSSLLTPQSITTRYDGSTILEGLFFGEGPAAALFPEIWSDTQVLAALGRSKWTAKQHKLYMDGIRQLENEVSAIDPGFFSAFATDMQSGNPVLVQQALTRTQKDMETVADKHKTNWKAAVDNAANPDINRILYNNVAAINNAIIANNVAAVNNAIYWSQVAAMIVAVVAVVAIAVVAFVIPLNAKSGLTHYENDQFIALVTQRLAYG